MFTVHRSSVEFRTYNDSSRVGESQIAVGSEKKKQIKEMNQTKNERVQKNYVKRENG